MLHNSLRMFECLCCGSDKFHVCEEDNELFVVCAYCGIRSDIVCNQTCQLIESRGKDENIYKNIRYWKTRR
jgi:transcription elongation factor Elf1